MKIQINTHNHNKITIMTNLKKTILAGAVALMAIPAFGQLTVAKNGMCVFGKPTINYTWSNGAKVVPFDPPTTSWTVSVDSTACAVFLGKGVFNGGGHISFGANKQVYIGELPGSTSERSSRLHLYGSRGFYGQTSLGRVFAYYRSDAATAVTYNEFQFFTDVRANGFVVDSDSRLKANVESLSGSEDMLSQISPISYSLVTSTVARKERETGDEAAAEADPVTPDPRSRFGFMAQEVQEVFPELVVEGEDGVLGIDYIGFIPILVDAVKNLRAKVESQQEEITALRMQNGTRKAAPASGESSLSILATESVIYQNRPNPFSGTTQIPYDVPEGVGQADIYIYTLQGQQVMHAVVEERGSGQLTVEAASLTPGMYIYTLIADGVEVGSKRMVVTD